MPLMEPQTELPKMTERLEILLRAGLAFCTEGGFVQEPWCQSALSAWLSHAVIRRAHLSGDDRWRFGAVLSEISNKAHRDNLRADRAAPIGTRPAYPFADEERYYRQTHLGDPQYYHIVAFSEENGLVIDVVDLNVSRWYDKQRLVSGSPVWWARHREGVIAPPNLDGAEWDSYFVVQPDLGPIIKQFPTMSSAAASRLDAIVCW